MIMSVTNGVANYRRLCGMLDVMARGTIGDCRQKLRNSPVHVDAPLTEQCTGIRGSGRVTSSKARLSISRPGGYHVVCWGARMIGIRTTERQEEGMDLKIAP